MDRLSHCFFLSVAQRLLLAVAVPEEDGVVHRDRELEHCRQSLCYIGYLAEKVVCSEVQQYHHADRGKEDERNEPSVEEY